ncbi:MAG: 50S ribosomal protein L22 [Actinomycetota bacterium]|nr:50S ribosomal protein L22 [Actinomycetota bacterium]
MTGPKTNERPGTKAVLRHSRVAANKAREVLDLIRNKPVREAEAILRFAERDVAQVVGKVLHSAIANAENNDDQEAEELYVSACFADEGTTIKRWRPRARGRATRIRKRTSHITVVVSRMPSAQLERTQARRRAEQLAERARRVAGARRAEGDTRTRAERRSGVQPSAAEVDAVEPAAGDGGDLEVAGREAAAELPVVPDPRQDPGDGPGGADDVAPDHSAAGSVAAEGDPEENATAPAGSTETMADAGPETGEGHSASPETTGEGAGEEQ